MHDMIEGDRDKRPAIRSEPANPIEVFYQRFGEELIKQQLPFLNDTLRQMVALNVLLLGGGLFFLSADNCLPSLRMAAMALFFVALLVAFVGMLPWGVSVPVFEVRAMREAIDRITGWKSGAIWGASICMGLGLAVAFAGVMMK